MLSPFIGLSKGQKSHLTYDQNNLHHVVEKVHKFFIFFVYNLQKCIYIKKKYIFRLLFLERLYIVIFLFWSANRKPLVQVPNIGPEKKVLQRFERYILQLGFIRKL